MELQSYYRTRAKIRANLFKTHAVIFEKCLFKISINFEAFFFKIYVLFWLISIY